MVSQRLYSPIFVLLLLLFGLQSCKKESRSITVKQSNIAEIDRNIALGDKYFVKDVTIVPIIISIKQNLLVI